MYGREYLDSPIFLKNNLKLIFGPLAPLNAILFELKLTVTKNLCSAKNLDSLSDSPWPF